MEGSLIPFRAAFLSAVLGLSLASSVAYARTEPAKPNIVVILTDDEDVAAHAFMPKTRSLIADQGVTFKNFFVSYPFCCPSRASILRGQYGHNTGVMGNEPPYGGYEKLHGQGLEKSTLATWLSDAGYRTAMIGKYINRYEPERDGVPPGWKDWYVTSSGAHPSYNYVLNENGKVVRYGDEPKDYLNDVLTGKAVKVIREAAKAAQPFFLYVLPLTPHSPAAAAPRHVGMFADAKLPRSPAFDEADVSDKPALIQALPRLDEATVAFMEGEYRRRLASLQAIDDMVETLVKTLTQTGQIDNTYIVYSSDNGFTIGEHRLPAGKVYPYDENLRVPMVMRGPGVPKGTRIEAMTLNIDLAPTFAEIAGAATPDYVDGRSFLPLLLDSQTPWRQSFLLERRQLEEQMIALARRQGVPDEELLRAADYNGLRTLDLAYVEYGTGERELYDLIADPFQLSNLATSAAPNAIAALSKRVAQLSACAAAECRELEDLPADFEFRAIAKSDDATVVPASVGD